MSNTKPGVDTVQQIFNAARNFKALAENLGHVDPDSLNEPIASHIQEFSTISRSCIDRITFLTGKPPQPLNLAAREAQMSKEPHLDPSKLERALVFARKIEKWLSSVEADRIPGKGKAVLSELGSALLQVEQTSGDLYKKFHLAVHSGVWQNPTADGGSPELLLVNGRQQPLLDEWGGQFRLNGRAKSLLKEYLDLIGTSEDQQTRRGWERKAEKWLIATPTGMALILRSRQYDGETAVYPKYLPKDAISDRD